MKIFWEKTWVELDGLGPFKQPAVVTKVIKYIPQVEDDDIWRPNKIIYIRTEVDTYEDTPDWVVEAIQMAVSCGQLKIMHEEVAVDWSEAKAIRKAIQQHDDTVERVQKVLKEAADIKKAP